MYMYVNVYAWAYVNMYKGVVRYRKHQNRYIST